MENHEVDEFITTPQREMLRTLRKTAIAGMVGLAAIVGGKEAWDHRESILDLLSPVSSLSVETDFYSSDAQINPLYQQLIADIVTAPVRTEEGDKAVVPGWRWVDVLNPEEVQSGNGEFRLGDICGVSTGGAIEIVRAGEPLMVQYMAPEKAYGTNCPTGIQFELSKEEFSDMSRQYTIKVAEAEALRLELEQVHSGERIFASKLKGELESIDSNIQRTPEGAPYKVGDTFSQGFQWVDVVNLRPVSSVNETVVFRDSGDFDRCSVDENGHSTVLGYLGDGRILVEFREDTLATQKREYRLNRAVAELGPEF